MLAAVGLVMVAYGLSTVSVPLAIGTVGAVLVVVGVAGAWSKGGRL